VVARHAASGAHHVINPDAHSDVSAVDYLLQRVDERDRTGQVGAQCVEHQRAFLEGLEYEGEVELLEVAQSAVEQLAGATRRTCGVVAGFDQAHLQAPGDRIQRAPGTDDTAADDQDV